MTPKRHSAEEREEWRPVAEFDGLYSVSNTGRVRAEERVVHRGWAIVHAQRHIITGSLDPYGYIQFSLHNHGKRSTRKGHALVAEAFIGPRPHGMDIAHYNGVRTDNRVENLRYCTRAENCQDKIRHGTSQRGEKAPGAKLSRLDVVAIRTDPRSQRKIACAYRISQQQVSDVKRRRRWGWL